MNALERHHQKLQRRTLISVGIFVVFMVVASIAGVQGTTFNDNTLIPLLVLLIGAFTVLPRSAVPSNYPRGETPEAQDQLDFMRERLLSLEQRATYQRFFYAGIAFLLLGALPRLGL